MYRAWKKGIQITKKKQFMYTFLCPEHKCHYLNDDLLKRSKHVAVVNTCKLSFVDSVLRHY